MFKKAVILTLSILLALSAAAILSGCTETEDNPVQIFINENREDLEAMSADHLEMLGPGATVNFESDEGEFIYVYAWGPGPTVEELEEHTRGFVELPENIQMYETLADYFAQRTGVDSLVLTVRYYDGQGNLIVGESFTSP